jgi:hypothetical protein
MDAPIWLKMLHRWLKGSIDAEEEVARLRARQERKAVELRKAEVSAWFLQPPY